MEPNKVKMKTNNFFVSLFGDFGELIQFMLALFTFMGLMMVAPMLMVKISTWLTEPTPSKTVTSTPPLTHQNKVIDQIIQYDSLGRFIAMSLNSQIVTSKNTIESKREALTQFAAQIDSLELTPYQRVQLSGHILKNADDISFSSWVASRPVLYNIIVGFINSLLFYVLGRRKRKQLNLAATTNSHKDEVTTK